MRPRPWDNGWLPNSVGGLAASQRGWTIFGLPPLACLLILSPIVKVETRPCRHSGEIPDRVQSNKSIKPFPPQRLSASVPATNPPLDCTFDLPYQRTRQTLLGQKIVVSRRAFLILALIIGATWLWFAVIQPRNTIGGVIPGVQPGSQAPDFTLQTLDGNSVTLSDLRGQPVIINMWASWCGPCKYEMPAIQHVYEEFRDLGLVVLAVNITKKDNLASVKSFVDEYELTFPVLLDTEGHVEDAYQLRGLPSSFFIARDGTVQSVVIGGPMSEGTIRSLVEKLIVESRPQGDQRD